MAIYIRSPDVNKSKVVLREGAEDYRRGTRECILASSRLMIPSLKKFNCNSDICTYVPFGHGRHSGASLFYAILISLCFFSMSSATG